MKECKGGLKAVPYYDKRNNKVFPTDSVVRQSWTANVHSNKGLEHAGGFRNKSLSTVQINFYLSITQMLKEI